MSALSPLCVSESALSQNEEPASTESDLLAAAIDGAPQALERLMLGYQSRLLARIRRKLPIALRGSLEPEDVLQETFVEVFRNIATFRPHSTNAFARWLVMIADNKLIDAIRARQTIKRGGGFHAIDAGATDSSMASLLELLQGDSHTPSRSVAGRDVERAVHAALADLKDDYREAVRLRFLEGLSLAEAAERMQRSEWSVYKLCIRGLSRLREGLGDPARFLSAK
jgi:RNA polymerase sigma-70 factor, ECF subfamily